MNAEPQRFMLVADATVHPAGMLTLNDRDRLVSFVDELCYQIGMEEIDKMARVIPPEIDSGPGVSVLSLITTSHIVIHTFPRFAHFMLDVSSCKRFCPNEALDFIRDELEVKEWRTVLAWPQPINLMEL